MRSTYVPLRAAGCKGGEAARVVLERMGRFSGEGLQFWIAPNVGRDALTYSSERISPSMTQLAVSGSSYVGWGYLPSPCLAIGRSTFAAHPVPSSVRRGGRVAVRWVVAGRGSLASPERRAERPDCACPLRLRPETKLRRSGVAAGWPLSTGWCAVGYSQERCEAHAPRLARTASRGTGSDV